MTPGREEEWTLSVTHTDEAVDAYVACFEEMAAKSRSDFASSRPTVVTAVTSPTRSRLRRVELCESTSATADAAHRPAGPTRSRPTRHRELLPHHHEPGAQVDAQRRVPVGDDEADAAAAPSARAAASAAASSAAPVPGGAAGSRKSSPQPRAGERRLARMVEDERAAGDRARPVAREAAARQQRPDDLAVHQRAQLLALGRTVAAARDGRGGRAGRRRRTRRAAHRRRCGAACSIATPVRAPARRGVVSQVARHHASRAGAAARRRRRAPRRAPIAAGDRRARASPRSTAATTRSGATAGAGSHDRRRAEGPRACRAR